MDESNSLLTLPYDKITFDQIKAFCSLKIHESTRVAYKKELVKEKILRTIAAMANTDGGIIIVGVPEEKEQGGQRSIPGNPEGVQAKNARQTIVNWCYAFLQPVYCPEIKEIPVGDSSKAVVFIRINRDEVPSIPVSVLEQGIFIRVDEGDRIADLTHIRMLIKEDETKNIKLNNEMKSWLHGKIPNIVNFCWCTVGLVLPMKRLVKHQMWSSMQIMELRNVLYTHQIRGSRPWTGTWCPFPQPVMDYKSREERYLLSDHFTDIQLRRYEQDVHFWPGYHEGLTTPNHLRGNWFSIYCNVRGFLLVSIGIPSDTDRAQGEKILRAFFAIFDLFNQEGLRNCYPHSLWQGSSFNVFAQVTNVPKLTLLTNDVTLPNYTYGHNPIWGGPHETETLNDITPDKMAKNLASRLFAFSNLLDYEDYVNSFKSW